MITYYVDADAAGGGDGSSGSPYDSLSAAEAARNTADGVGGGGGAYTDIVRYLCSASSGGADTTGVTIFGGSQTAAYYLLIQTDTGHRASAKWNASKYRIEVANTFAIDVNDDYVRVDGVQARVTSVSSSGAGSFTASGNIAASNRIDFSNCLALGPDSDDTNYYVGFSMADSDTIANIYNCVVRRVASGSSARLGIDCSGVSASIYNCTVIGGQMAVRAQGSCVVTARNVYGGGSTFDCFYRRDTAYLYKTNCASSDGTADDTSSYETASNCLVNIALDATTFLDPLNATVIDRDWHLADTDSDLYGAGVEPGGADPLNYTTDIDGDTIGGGGRYDIGADWYYTAPAAETVKFFLRRRRW